MRLRILDIGDKVRYPDLVEYDGDGCLTVIDRNIVQHTRTKIFVQYLYDGLIERLVADMHDNIDDDYDNVIVIDGKEGSGKSNLAYQICKIFDPDFNLEDGYIYDFNTFMRNISADNIKGKIFWLDEATNLANSRDAMRRDNVNLVKVLQMMRSRGMSLVMCIPSINTLDVYIREHRVRYLLTTLEKSWESHADARRGYFELRHPIGGGVFTTRGYGRFDRIPPEVKDRYEEIKLNAQTSTIRRINEKLEEDSNKGRKRDKERTRRMGQSWKLLSDAGWSYEEIATKMGVSVSTIGMYIKRAQEYAAEDDER